MKLTENMKITLTLGQLKRLVRESSTSQKLDENYLKAVEDGDMDMAQKMVLFAAAKAMPKTKVVDKNGVPLIVWRGEKSELHHVKRGLSWYTMRKDYASLHGEKGLGCYFLNFENPAMFCSFNNGFIGDAFWKAYDLLGDYTKCEDRPTNHDIQKFFDQHSRTPDEFLLGEFHPMEGGFPDWKLQQVWSHFSKWLQGRGFDGVIDRVYDTELEFVSFNPRQVKSAAPVTHDDEGNVIPLSQRFDMDNPDIRY